jgi:GTPase SAR1 family protein
VKEEDSDSQEETMETQPMHTTSIEGLQTEEQRLVLDTIAQIRKCGLESVLSLPQLVVCGDQSAGKSSVLEALTEIPFPRNDNLCTRFATEIILRRGQTNSLAVKVIADPERSAQEQQRIGAFNESITDFADLPGLIDKAMVVMGIDNASDSGSSTRAFARDVLSIDIEGPTRPQLTLVDLPGLIQNETKGVTKSDVDLVKEITDHYISNPRTICLAVVSATNDYANQGILSKVRDVDPNGERTLGIITKPDRLPSGSGSETAYLNLARNEDVFFKLGWHVLKNRSYEEGHSSFEQRNASEAAYFRTSNFKILPKDNVGIESLRTRLSKLLFNHVKQELPKLREDLDKALGDNKKELEKMGGRRATPQECRTYMTQLSQDVHGVCQKAVDGHYEGRYFTTKVDPEFSLTSPNTLRRLRACVQVLNTQFSDEFRKKAHKYYITRSCDAEEDSDESTSISGYTGNRKAIGFSDDEEIDDTTLPEVRSGIPAKLSAAQSLHWVGQALVRTRGRELSGNFNPLLVGELFWEQSCNWSMFARDHTEEVADMCSRFLEALLEEMCPKDILSRLWSSHIQDMLKERCENALQELDKIMRDIKGYPINYNHYYTDTIKKERQRRESRCSSRVVESSEGVPTIGNAVRAISNLAQTISKYIDPDMGRHSCEEALDCLIAIYKVCLPALFILSPTNPSQLHNSHTKQDSL